AALVLRMMAKKPQDRFQTCLEVQEAIDAILHPPPVAAQPTPPPSKSRIPFLAGGLVLLLAGLLVAALVLGWLPFLVPGTTPEPPDTSDQAAEEYRAAIALLESDPPRVEEALQRLRSIRALYGLESEFGELARREIERILNAREQEAARHLETARRTTEIALSEQRFDDALEIVEGLYAATARTASEDAAVLFTRTTRRRVRQARLEGEAEAMAKEHRYREILEMLDAVKESLPGEDRPFVQEMILRWKARRDAWESEGEKALAKWSARWGDPPEDLPSAILDLKAFASKWRGSRAAASADAARLRFEERLISSGDAEADFHAVETFLDQNRLDLDTAIARFQALAKRYPETPWGPRALNRVKELEVTREREAQKAFAGIRDRVRDLSPEKALKAYATFPKGLRGSRVYREEVRPEILRCSQGAEARKAGAQSTLERAESLLRESPPPIPAKGFREILEAFLAVRKHYPGTPEADLAAMRVERLETDRRLEANKAYAKALESVADAMERKAWAEAQTALEKGFLDIYSDSPLMEKALGALERIQAARIASRYRGREEEAVAQIERYGRENPEDYRGILSRYEELRSRLSSPDLASRVAGRIEAVRNRFEQAASARLNAVRVKASAEEEAGRSGAALGLYRAFPETFRGTRAYEDARAEAARLEGGAVEGLREAGEILRRDPAAILQALRAYESIRKAYPDTSWARTAEKKSGEIRRKAEREGRRKLSEGETLYRKGRYKEAGTLAREVASWGVDPVSQTAADLARRCEVRRVRESLLALISAGRYAEGITKARRLIADPAYTSVAEEIRSLIVHAENLKAGFVYVPGGVFEVRGRVHTVPPFYILATEVTNAQYRLFIVAGGYGEDSLWEVEGEVRRGFRDRTGRPGPRHWRDGAFPKGRAGYPARYLSWHEARAYARWKGGDLPTEAQWMMAAGWDPERRTLRDWPWGDAFDAERASKPVGSFAGGASYYGCLDMAGNVSEWVLDWSDLTRKKYRLLKGGDSSDFDPEERTRTSAREKGSPESATPLAGFRIVRKAERVSED
ncbi:MAG: SUMF1/EgtB/PvdO family nonheme iron enzyme, partial [Planctomycetota bacterium]